MDWVSSNWFFLAVLLLCVGMHLFHGHGHGHGQGGGGKRNDDS